MSREINSEFINELSDNMKEILPKREEFSRIVNKLLSDTIIVKSLETDNEDYYYIQDNESLISSYLAFIDYELDIDSNNGFATITPHYARNKLALRKLDTIICLELKLYYYQKKKEISTHDSVIMELEKLEEVLINKEYFKKNPSKNELTEVLRRLKNFKIINFDKGTLTQSDFSNISFEILSSIMFLIPTNDIDSLNSTIEAYKNTGEEV